MNAYPPPPVPPPALVARDLRPRWKITLEAGAPPVPVAWDAVFRLDGVIVTGPDFFERVRQITNVNVHEGQIDRVEGEK